jgi:uncharacterized protein YciI
MRILARCLFALSLLAPVLTAQISAQDAAPAATPAKTWFVRLIPPRPTFATDMTASEKALMQQHFVYWTEMYKKGICVFGGPVLDPHGIYGVLAIRAASEDEARAIASADPSVKAGVNHIEVAEIHIAFPPPAS